MKRVMWCVALLASVSFAAPSVFPYQGRLDKNGIPQSGNFDFRLTLFSAATGGAALWSGDFTGVPVVNGNFSLKIGSTTALPNALLAQPTLFLDVQVKGAGDATLRQLAGRQQWLHVPFAATSAGDFRVNGALTAGLTPDGGTLLPTTTPSATVGNLLRVTGAGGAKLDVTPGSLDNAAGLSLEASGGTTTVGGAMNVTGQVNAPNTWRRVYDGDVNVTTAAPLTFAVPNNMGHYKVFYRGLMFTTADSRLLLRVGPSTSSIYTNYGSFMAAEGAATFSESDTTGIYLGRSVSNRSCNVNGELNVFNTNAFSGIIARGEGVVWDYLAVSQPLYGMRFQGNVSSATQNIAAMQFAVTSSSATWSGHITVYALP